MKKKLVIKFWKAEKALAMQILEQEGLPKEKEEGFVRIVSSPAMFEDEIYLRGEASGNYNMCYSYIETDSKRDAYISKITNAITDELFTGKGELEVGEMCEFRVDEHCLWCKYKLLAILPESYDNRYIASARDYYWMAFKEARPIAKRTEPKVKENGEVITYIWEEE